MPQLTNGNKELPKKRSLYSLYMVTLKKRVEEALTSVFDKQTLKVDVQNQHDYEKTLSRINNSIQQAQKWLSVDIKKSGDKRELVNALEQVRMAIKEIPSVDLSSLNESLENVRKAVGSIEIPETSNDDVVTQLLGIKKALAELPKKFPKSPEIKIPKPEKIEFPSSISMVEASKILTALDKLSNEVKSIPKNMPKEKHMKMDLSPLIKQVKAVEKAVQGIKVPELDFPNSIEVSNFPPTRIPTPVTSVWINSLRGPVLATQVTVGATATVVPASPIAQRRSLLLFNNSSSVTVYLGDENVNSSDGMPLLPKQYSPSFDIGDNIEMYAITSSSTADVRCFEVSMDDQGA